MPLHAWRSTHARPANPVSPARLNMSPQLALPACCPGVTASCPTQIPSRPRPQTAAVLKVCWIILIEAERTVCGLAKPSGPYIDGFPIWKSSLPISQLWPGTCGPERFRATVNARHIVLLQCENRSQNILSGIRAPATCFSAHELLADPLAHPKAFPSSSNQHEGSPEVGQILAVVAHLHLFAHFELRLFQCLVDLHPAEPLRVKALHQFGRLFVGHRPQRHEDILGACLLEGAPQSENPFAILHISLARVTSA